MLSLFFLAGNFSRSNTLTSCNLSGSHVPLWAQVVEQWNGKRVLVGVSVL